MKNKLFLLFVLFPVFVFAQFGNTRFPISVYLQQCTHNGVPVEFGGIPVAGCAVYTDLAGNQQYGRDTTYISGNNLVREVTNRVYPYEVLFNRTLDISSLLNPTYIPNRFLFSGPDGYPSVNADWTGDSLILYNGPMKIIKINTTTIFGEPSANIAIGLLEKAFNFPAASGGNIFIGDYYNATDVAIDLTTGDNNVAIGTYTGDDLTTGSNNVFIGTWAGLASTSAFSNVFIGDLTGLRNTEGDKNIAIGSNALLENTTGLRNIAIGEQALRNPVTFSNNIALGRFSGINAAGSSNLFLGNGTGSNAVTGNIIIGINAGSLAGAVSNKLIIANSGSDDFILGDMSTDELQLLSNLFIRTIPHYGTPDSVLVIGSGRIVSKYAISDLTGGVDFNFAENDLTATGNRLHDFIGFNLTIDDIGISSFIGDQFLLTTNSAIGFDLQTDGDILLSHANGIPDDQLMVRSVDGSFVIVGHEDHVPTYGTYYVSGGDIEIIGNANAILNASGVGAIATIQGDGVAIDGINVYLTNLPPTDNTNVNILVRDAGSGEIELRDASTIITTDLNFAEDDLSLPGNRNHDFNNNQMHFNEVRLFEIDGTHSVSSLFDVNTFRMWIESNEIIAQNLTMIDNTIDSVLVRDNVTGQIKLRSASSIGGADLNFAEDDLSATGNRTHDFNSFDLTINELDVTNFSGTQFLLNTNSTVGFDLQNDGDLLLGHANGVADDQIMVRNVNGNFAIIGHEDDVPSNYGAIFVSGGDVELRGNLTSVVNSIGGDAEIIAFDDIILDAPEIFITNLPATNNTATAVLIRNVITGEIEQRDVSTITPDTDTHLGNTNLTSTSATRIFNTLTQLIIRDNVNNNALFQIAPGSGIFQMTTDDPGGVFFEVLGTDGGAVINITSDNGANENPTINFNRDGGAGDLSTVRYTIFENNSEDLSILRFPIASGTGSPIVDFRSDLSSIFYGDVFLNAVPTTDNTETNLLVRDATTGEIELRTVASLPGGGGNGIYGSSSTIFADLVATTSGNGATFLVSVGDVFNIDYNDVGGVPEIYVSSGSTEVYSYEGNILLFAPDGDITLQSGNDADDDILIQAPNGTIEIQSTSEDVYIHSDADDIILQATDVINMIATNGYILGTAPPTDNTEDKILMRDDGTGQIELREISSLPSGITDHGALTGLGDDDHTQYVLANGTRNISNSGVVNWHVISTNNNAIISVDGFTGNDAYIRYSINGTDLWSQGVDDAINTNWRVYNESLAATAWSVALATNITTFNNDINLNTPAEITSSSGHDIIFDPGGVANVVALDDIELQSDLFWINTTNTGDYAAVIRLTGESTADNYQGLYLQYDAAGNQSVIGSHNTNDALTASDIELILIPRDGTGWQFLIDPTVPNEAYGVSWNGSLEVPTKDALYDIINTLPTSDTHFGNTDLTFTNNRTHSVAGFNFAVNNIGALAFRTTDTDLELADQQFIINDDDAVNNLAIDFTSQNQDVLMSLISAGANSTASIYFQNDAANYQIYLNGLSDALLFDVNGNNFLAVAPLTGVSTFSFDVIVPDEAYGVGWNSNFEVPTKNAIYDIINTLPTGPAGSAEEVQFRNGGVFGANTLFQWDNSDHVLGIGIAAPTAPDYFLHLHNPVTNNSTGVFYTNATSGTTLLTDGFFTGYSDKAFFINYENTAIEWYTNATLRMIIEGGGDVGIGVSNPSVKLEIDGVDGASVILMQNAEYLGGKNSSAVAKRIFGISASNIVYLGAIDDVGGDVRIREDALDVITLSGQQVAINHLTPLGDLHVISLDPTNRSSIIAQNDNSTTAFTSTFPALSLRNNNTTANNYVRMNFQDASSTAAAAIASQITDHTNDYGTLEFWTRSSAGFSQKLLVSDVGNIGIGQSSFGTSAVKVLALGNGTAPTTAPADAVQIWAADVTAGQSNLFARNEADAAEQITGLAVRVTSNFTVTSSTALTNITGLSRNVEAGKNYSFRAVLYTTSINTAGIKAAISGTATATNIIYQGTTSSSATAWAGNTRATALGTTVAAVTAVTAGTIYIDGTITVNAAGTLTVQFAQNVSSGTGSVVLQGSSFEIKPLSN